MFFRFTDNIYFCDAIFDWYSIRVDNIEQVECYPTYEAI